MQEIKRLNEKELARGTGLEGSWHDQYKDSAWVYVGGLDVQLSEGDVICVMSQWGEVSPCACGCWSMSMPPPPVATGVDRMGWDWGGVWLCGGPLTLIHTCTCKQIEDVHLVRDKGSGKSKGFAFIKYEDQRSTVLAVDNFNGIKVRGCLWCGCMCGGAWWVLVGCGWVFVGERVVLSSRTSQWPPLLTLFF